MTSSCFKKIELLTIQAIDLVNRLDLNSCNECLSERQKLLDILLEKVIAQKDDRAKEKFIDLLSWIKEQDNNALIQITQLKIIQKDKLLTQAKNSRAISHYKNNV